MAWVLLTLTLCLRVTSTVLAAPDRSPQVCKALRTSYGRWMARSGHPVARRGHSSVALRVRPWRRSSMRDGRASVALPPVSLSPCC